MSISEGRSEQPSRAPTRVERRSEHRTKRRHGRGRRDSNGLTAAERLVVENEGRLGAVRRVLSLNGGMDDVLGRLTALGAKALRTPFAAVSFVERDRQVYKCAVGLPDPWRSRGEIPLVYSYCKHAVATGRPLIVDDVRRHPLLRSNPSVRELGALAYAGIPLITRDGHALGTFNIIDQRPRSWTLGELDAVTELAAAVTAEIDQFLAQDATAQRLEQTLRTHNETLAMTAHDLRNYLNVISLGVSLLAENSAAPAPERERDLQRIQTSAQQMDRMIQDLLDAARLDDGSFPLRPSVVVADGLVTEATALMRPVAAKRNLNLVAAPGGAGATVVADRDAMTRVFSNLIGNAIKFTPVAGTITVWSEDAGNEVRFAVADTGAGIEESELGRVFERFWQSRAHRVPGAGLGLAIARGLVEAHGGRIWVESQPGVGTTFFFALPAAPA